jgi:hypothetical protein
MLRLPLPVVSTFVVLAGALAAQDAPAEKAAPALRYTIRIEAESTTEGGFRGAGGKEEQTQVVVFVEQQGEKGVTRRRYEKAELENRGDAGKQKVEGGLVGKDLHLEEGDEGVVVREGADGEPMSRREVGGLPKSVSLEGLLPDLTGVELVEGAELEVDGTAFRGALRQLFHPVRPAAPEGDDAAEGDGGDQPARPRRGRGGRDPGGREPGGQEPGGRGGRRGGGGFGGMRPTPGIELSPVAQLLASEDMEGEFEASVSEVRDEGGHQIVVILIGGEFTGEGVGVTPFGRMARGPQRGRGGRGQGGEDDPAGGRDARPNPMEDMDAAAAMLCSATVEYDATAQRVRRFELRGKGEQSMSGNFGGRDFEVARNGEMHVEVMCDVAEKAFREDNKN